MSSRNRVEVPEAKEALNRFKMEVASELGVPLTNGYNGNLTSYQNGSVGGYMVKKMIQAQEEKMAGKQFVNSIVDRELTDRDEAYILYASFL